MEEQTVPNVRFQYFMYPAPINIFSGNALWITRFQFWEVTGPFCILKIEESLENIYISVFHIYYLLRGIIRMEIWNRTPIRLTFTLQYFPFRLEMVRRLKF